MSDTWIMAGVKKTDPARIKTCTQAIDYINEVGFLPLFKNNIPGFSLEEHTYGPDWWSDDETRDPWEWRRLIAKSGRVAYGKFFDNKAGFVSLEWFPYFANYRRDGYDYDARFDDGLASYRSKKLMDLFETHEALFSFEMKALAGFGKDGEKNFEGTLTALEMQTYLCVKNFERRTRKSDGKAYGWGIAVCTTPEKMWGRDLVAAAYKEEPEISREKIIAHIQKTFHTDIIFR